MHDQMMRRLLVVEVRVLIGYLGFRDDAKILKSQYVDLKRFMHFVTKIAVFLTNNIEMLCTYVTEGILK